MDEEEGRRGALLVGLDTFVVPSIRRVAGVKKGWFEQGPTLWTVRLYNEMIELLTTGTRTQEPSVGESDECGLLFVQGYPLVELLQGNQRKIWAVLNHYKVLAYLEHICGAISLWLTFPEAVPFLFICFGAVLRMVPLHL